MMAAHSERTSKASQGFEITPLDSSDCPLEIVMSSTTTRIYALRQKVAGFHGFQAPCCAIGRRGSASAQRYAVKVKARGGKEEADSRTRSQSERCKNWSFTKCRPPTGLRQADRPNEALYALLSRDRRRALRAGVHKSKRLGSRSHMALSCVGDRWREFNYLKANERETGRRQASFAGTKDESCCYFHQINLRRQKRDELRITRSRATKKS